MIPLEYLPAFLDGLPIAFNSAGIVHRITDAVVRSVHEDNVSPAERLLLPIGDDQAFVTNGKQGINYRAGTWHHVLLTPYAAMRFVCVDRDSPDDNCVDFHIPESDQPLLELP